MGLKQYKIKFYSALTISSICVKIYLQRYEAFELFCTMRICYNNVNIQSVQFAVTEVLNNEKIEHG